MKRIILITTAIILSLSAWGQSYAPIPTTIEAFIEVPYNVPVKSDTDQMYLGFFKRENGELICVGGRTLNEVGSTVIKIYLADGSGNGLETTDTLETLVFSDSFSCNAFVHHSFENGNSYTDITANDTAIINSIYTEIGIFKYDRDHYQFCDDDAGDSIIPNIRVPEGFDWTITSAQYFDDYGRFVPSSTPIWNYAISIEVEMITKFCWTQDSVEILAITGDSIYVDPSIIGEVQTLDCESNGTFFLTDEVMQNFDSISLNNQTYSISEIDQSLKVPFGEYSLTALDKNKCPYYSDNIEFTATGDCDGSYHFFADQPNSTINFEETGKILIKNRSGETVHQIDGPGEWNGETSQGFLPTGLYFIQYEDGSTKKLKYYK